MGYIVFGLFFVLPILEIAAFIAVGDEIGIIGTLMLCLLSAAIGLMIVQKQGLDTLLKGRRALDEGQFPGQAMFDGFCIVIAGGLFILPGFVSDAVALALLIPPVREMLRGFLAQRADITVETYGPPRDPDIVEGTFERIDDPVEPNRRIG